jgi:hypothetical protein
MRRGIRFPAEETVVNGESRKFCGFFTEFACGEWWVGEHLIDKNQIIGNYFDLLTKICISLHRQKLDKDVRYITYRRVV